MKLPNCLTVSRLVLSLVLLLVLTSTSMPYNKTLALVVFVVAALTDWWDGLLARRNKNITPFGQLMDPLADKVLVTSAFISLVELQLVPAWIVVLIITREFLVTGLRLLLASSGHILSAGLWGKLKTIWQMVAIIAILSGLVLRDDILPCWQVNWMPTYNLIFVWVAWSLALIAAVVTMMSGIIYFSAHRRALMTQMNQAGTGVEL